MSAVLKSLKFTKSLPLIAIFLPILSLFWKFLRILETDYDSSAVVTEDEFFQNHKRNAYAELNVSNMKRAMGGNIRPIHIKAFTNALFKTLCNLANSQLLS